MSRILIISTTTHKKHSTSKMVLRGLMRLLSGEHEIKFIDASEIHIVPNLSCYSDGGKNCASKEAGVYRCWAHKLSHEKPSEYGGADQMGLIYDGLDWCDLVIWGTSVRWGSHSALMQKIIERMNTLENRVSVYGERNTLEGKKCGVVVTGHHYEAPKVAEHLLTQFGWFGFDSKQGQAMAWQKSHNIHQEQKGNNNEALYDFLISEEGQELVEDFLGSLGLK